MLRSFRESLRSAGGRARQKTILENDERKAKSVVQMVGASDDTMEKSIIFFGQQGEFVRKFIQDFLWDWEPNLFSRGRSGGLDRR